VVLDLSGPRFRNWLGRLRLVCGGEGQWLGRRSIKPPEEGKMPDENLLRADQVARRLGVSPHHVRRLWRQRKLPGEKLSPRRLRFRLQDVQEYQRLINELE